MRIETPPDLPRRELVDCERITLFGRPGVRITVARQTRTGTRELTTDYLLEWNAPWVVTFVKQGGEVYETSRHACTCMDGQVKSKERWCKHRTTCERLRLWDGPVAAGTSGA